MRFNARDGNSFNVACLQVGDGDPQLALLNRINGANLKFLESCGERGQELQI
jgi:hypothetical protein